MSLYNKMYGAMTDATANAMVDAYSFSVNKFIKDPINKYGVPFVQKHQGKVKDFLKPEYTPKTPTFEDYAWKTADLAIWKLMPTGALLGAGTGAAYAVHAQTKLDNPHATVSENAMRGAVIGATLGGLVGAPGVALHAYSGIKMARASKVGFNGNSINNPQGLGSAILNSPSY